jgi:hypothetical protein
MINKYGIMSMTECHISVNYNTDLFYAINDLKINKN